MKECHAAKEGTLSAQASKKVSGEESDMKKTKLRADNQAVIQMVSNSINHSRVMHMKISSITMLRAK